MQNLKTSNDAEILTSFEKKYNSVIQARAMLADPQNIIGELGRGSGKTTHILAQRLVRISYAMPRSVMALAGPSYAFVVDTFVPGILDHLNLYYTKGIHFEYGKTPPKHFIRPYVDVVDWKHSISFAWGTVIKFMGIDRVNTSGVGQNMTHIFVDEMLRISESNFTERLLPTMRGNRQIFGHSPYFAGITGFSSTPNFENDHDWWLSLEENMDKERIEELIYVAYRVSIKLAEVEQMKRDRESLKLDRELAKMDVNIEKGLRFAAKWDERLNEQRKGQTLYIKGSSFTNLVVLGLDYMRNQYKNSRHNVDKFKLSILGIRPTKVKDLFFAQFSPKNIYEDSYIYNTIDIHSVDGSYKKSSRDLKYCDANRPLFMGLDPGNFMSVVMAQEHGPDLRVLKNFWCIIPEEHREMAQKIDSFFEYHQRKTIYLHYDRAGNQRKEKYRNNPKGDTDAKIMKSELEALGWTVHLMSQDQRTIFHWQHYLLFSILFGERNPKAKRIKLCQYECEQLISCIWMSPRKKGDDNNIELDKSSEKKLDYEDQVWYSTQLPSALMYLVFGLYEKFLPDGKPDIQDYEGL